MSRLICARCRDCVRAPAASTRGLSTHTGSGRSSSGVASPAICYKSSPKTSQVPDFKKLVGEPDYPKTSSDSPVRNPPLGNPVGPSSADLGPSLAHHYEAQRNPYGTTQCSEPHSDSPSWERSRKPANYPTPPYII